MPYRPSNRPRKTGSSRKSDARQGAHESKSDIRTGGKYPAKRSRMSDRPLGDRPDFQKPFRERGRTEQPRVERARADQPRTARVYPHAASRPAAVFNPDEAKQYVVGRRAALELLRDDEARTKIEKIYLAYGNQGPQLGELLRLARANRVAMGELDKQKFRDLAERTSGGEDTQGVIVLVAQRGYQELEDVLASTATPLLIALDGVEDPHNVGAIIRSAEAVGASGILLPRRGAVLTPAVYKTSAGAANYLPIVKYGNLEQTIRKLQEESSVTCIGLAGEGESTIYDLDLSGPICFVTGSEEKGIHRLVRERCEKLASIPLIGKTASLNASVASAVALFEAVRQRAVAK